MAWGGCERTGWGYVLAVERGRCGFLSLRDPTTRWSGHPVYDRLVLTRLRGVFLEWLEGGVGVGFERAVVWRRGDGAEVGLVIRPLRLGFRERWAGWGIVPPEVPRRVLRDGQGRLVRDEQGLAVLVADGQGPGYRAACERYQARVAGLLIAEGLAGGGVTIQAQVPAVGEEATGYADAVLGELEAAGFSAGDVLWLCDEILRLSRLGGEHLAREEGRLRVGE